MFELMHQGKMNGYSARASTRCWRSRTRTRSSTALSKLKFLVIIDPLETETARFWENHGEFNDVDPATIQTEVFLLPPTCFAEEDGSLHQLRPLAAVALEGGGRRRARRKTDI